MASNMMVPASKHTLFMRGFSCRQEVDKIREFFCKESGSQVKVEFFKEAENRVQLFVALRFETKDQAKEILNKFDNASVLGDRITISWYKDLRRARQKEYERRQRGWSPVRDDRYRDDRYRDDRYRDDRYRDYPPRRSYGDYERDRHRRRYHSSSRSRSRSRDRSPSSGSSRPDSRSPSPSPRSKVMRRSRSFSHDRSSRHRMGRPRESDFLTDEGSPDPSETDRRPLVRQRSGSAARMKDNSLSPAPPLRSRPHRSPSDPPRRESARVNGQVSINSSTAQQSSPDPAPARRAASPASGTAPMSTSRRSLSSSIERPPHYRATAAAATAAAAETSYKNDELYQSAEEGELLASRRSEVTRVENEREARYVPIGAGDSSPVSGRGYGRAADAADTQPQPVEAPARRAGAREASPTVRVSRRRNSGSGRSPGDYSRHGASPDTRSIGSSVTQAHSRRADSYGKELPESYRDRRGAARDVSPLGAAAYTQRESPRREIRMVAPPQVKSQVAVARQDYRSDNDESPIARNHRYEEDLPGRSSNSELQRYESKSNSLESSYTRKRSMDKDKESYSSRETVRGQDPYRERAISTDESSRKRRRDNTQSDAVVKHTEREYREHSPAIGKYQDKDPSSYSSTLNSAEKEIGSLGFSKNKMYQVREKKEEIEKAYRQDCETFAAVVKMLINKDSSLEEKIQTSLRENLKEIGQRCIHELREYIEKIKIDEDL